MSNERGIGKQLDSQETFLQIAIEDLTLNDRDRFRKRTWPVLTTLVIIQIRKESTTFPPLVQF